MNVAETLGLRRKRVHLTSDACTVEGRNLPSFSLFVNENYYRTAFGAVKRNTRQRIIPLSGEVARALAGVMERSPFKAGGDLVFHSKGGRALCDRNLARRHLKPAGKRIGCEWVSWHCFRRTWATLADQLDLEISDRQSTKEHGDFRMTLHYTPKALSRRRVAIERISEGILAANDNSGNNEGNVQLAEFIGRGGGI